MRELSCPQVQVLQALVLLQALGLVIQQAQAPPGCLHSMLRQRVWAPLSLRCWTRRVWPRCSPRG